MTGYCEFCGDGPTCCVCGRRPRGRRPRGRLARLWARLFWWLGG